MKKFVVLSLLLLSFAGIVNAQTATTKASAATRTATTSDLVIKGNNIFIKGELKGHYKVNVDGGRTIVFIYDTKEQRVFVANHLDGKDTAPWNASASGGYVDVKYDAANPVESLVSYAVGKGVL
jgi:hypothetical protein